MEVWRLASGRYDPLSGEGARIAGGRWNSPGLPVVYASETLALCVVEALTHITGTFPRDYQAFQIELPENTIEILDTDKLKPDWAGDIGFSRAIGDQWLQQRRSLALRVPSAVVPASTNVLVNPLHTDAAEMKLISRQPFRFDPRMRP